MATKADNAHQIISVPQGGGALHGIGETFAPDLHTGTGNFTVPIAVPPGRNGLQPQLIDEISRGKLTTEYRYHHGYWDSVEREFRGFGMVEQFDTETFTDFHAAGAHGPDAPFAAVAEKHFSPPLLTKTWFHQGPVDDDTADWHELDWDADYWAGDPDALAHVDTTNEFLRELAEPRHRRDALRTLRGSILRTELYALDGSDRQDRPFTVTEHAYGLREESPPDSGADPRRFRIFFPHALAQRTTQWERGDEPMTQLSFTDDYDAYGQAQRHVNVAVPRGRDYRVAAPPGAPYLGTIAQTQYARRDDADRYMVTRVSGSESRETINDGSQTVFDLCRDARAGKVERKLFGQSFNYYDGGYFVQGTRVAFDFHTPDLPHRGLPVVTRDPLGAEATIAYDRPYHLLPVTATDAVGLTTSAEQDYRVLQPRLVTDANGNRRAVTFSPMGLVTATTLMGKAGETAGDTLDVPGTRVEYDLLAFAERQEPVFVRTIVREHHVSDTDVPLPDRDRTIESVQYTDGQSRGGYRPVTCHVVRVLIVEDERTLAQVLSGALQAEHYDVVVAATGEDGFYRASAELFDLALLDLMLPGRSGLEILRTLHQRRIETPVLILTARDGLDDRVLGLDFGAGNYLVKPFALPELLARIRALLRPGRPSDVFRLKVGDLELDLVARRVVRSDKLIDLTAREFEPARIPPAALGPPGTWCPAKMLAQRRVERTTPGDAARQRQRRPDCATPSEGGSGLGLAIARWAVEANGGQISFLPTANGAAFRITRPLSTRTMSGSRGRRAAVLRIVMKVVRSICVVASCS